MEGISRSTPRAVNHEKGLDQVACGEVMFPDETSHRLGATAAAGAEKLMLGHGGKTTAIDTAEGRNVRKRMPHAQGNRGMGYAAFIICPTGPPPDGSAPRRQPPSEWRCGESAEMP